MEADVWRSGNGGWRGRRNAALRIGHPEGFGIVGLGVGDRKTTSRKFPNCRSSAALSRAVPHALRARTGPMSFFVEREEVSRKVGALLSDDSPLNSLDSTVKSTCDIVSFSNREVPRNSCARSPQAH